MNTDAERRKGARALTTLLSDVCDGRYPLTPWVRNEMLSRRSLTSQGAKARRDLLEAMIEHAGEPLCGIAGYGPERAMYEAVLARTGIHRRRASGGWELGGPTNVDTALGYAPAWAAIVDAFDESTGAGLPMTELYARLTAPPFGLKEGPIPVLLIAALIDYADSVAIFENGTFVTRLDTPTAERLIRNPSLFTLRRYAISGMRGAITGRLARVFGTRSVGRGQRLGEVVGATGALLGRARALPPFAQKTRVLSDTAKSVRSALFSAADPEKLLFETLPAAVGMFPFAGRSSRADDIEIYVEAVVRALNELGDLYPALLDGLVVLTGSELSVVGSTQFIRQALQARFGALRATPLSTSIQAFLYAVADDALDDDEWAEYVGMVLLSKPPQAWTDEDADVARARARELCERLRHIEAIHFGRHGRPDNGNVTALRVGVTRANGEDVSRVVHIDTSHVRQLDEVAAAALTEIRSRLGAAGPEALLARLADTVLGTDGTTGAVTSGGVPALSGATALTKRTSRTGPNGRTA
jgi:hypothetical protein